jgi:RHS repeat-associated protein
LAENIAGNGVQFVAYDGNGNVSALVNAANGATVANYEYGPFGELIRATGPMAKLNPFRFSTKYYDDETDLIYYGYRYYKPSTGTWLCKDPIGERGGPNLYGFLKNDSVDAIDLLGMATYSGPFQMFGSSRFLMGKQQGKASSGAAFRADSSRPAAVEYRRQSSTTCFV